jgi:hypothetical protein
MKTLPKTALASFEPPVSGVLGLFALLPHETTESPKPPKRAITAAQLDTWRVIVNPWVISELLPVARR